MVEVKVEEASEASVDWEEVERAEGAEGQEKVGGERGDEEREEQGGDEEKEGHLVQKGWQRPRDDQSPPLS